MLLDASTKAPIEVQEQVAKHAYRLNMIG